jgi:hypothetical protein
MSCFRDFEINLEDNLRLDMESILIELYLKAST